MSLTKGTPPGANAGDTSPLTLLLRPPLRLTAQQCSRARRLRRRGMRIPDIAGKIGAQQGDVAQALLAMRTTKLAATRRSLNVTVEAHQFVKQEAGPVSHFGRQ